MLAVFREMLVNLAASAVSDLSSPTGMLGYLVGLGCIIYVMIAWHRRMMAKGKRGMGSWYFIVSALIVAGIAIAAAGYGIGLRHATSVQANAAPPKSRPELRVKMLGGSVFIPNSPPNTTGINLSVRVWNTGSESPITEWRLFVVPKGAAPVLAQYTDMHNDIKGQGKNTSEVMRRSDFIGERTTKEPVGASVITGTVLFLVNLPQAVVVNPTTRYELSIKDIYEAESSTTQLIGEWQQLK